MKKLLIIISILSLLQAHADSPGKKYMNDSRITIKNITRLNDYDFYWQIDNDSAKIFNHDTMLTVPGSQGKPYNATLWAVNKKTNVATERLSFDNYYAPDYEITVDTISSDKIIYSKNTIDNYNTNDFGDNDAEEGQKSRSNIILFSTISIIALVVLIWIFMKRKNRTQGTGS